MRTCRNCKNRRHYNVDGLIELCYPYERSGTEAEDIENASDCDFYEYEDKERWCSRDDYYTPSSTRGDYSPSNPWDAPGMSIHDFI